MNVYYINKYNNDAFVLAVYCVYKNGEKYGLYQEWFDNGQQRAECNFIRDVLNGDYQEWYKDGQVSIVSRFNDGILTGPYTRWYNNGRKWEEYVYACQGPNHNDDSFHNLYEYRMWSPTGDLLDERYI